MKRPNIVLIMSDQHNPHVMGCAGDPYAQTPNLDRMAAGGVRFSSSYCAGPLCVPSRLTFLTSRYPSDIEAWVNSAALPSHTPTFAHQLTLAGYETTLCGRMHFIDADQNHGFQRRLVGDVSGAMRGAGSEMFEGIWNAAGCGQNHGSLMDDAVGPGTATYEVYDRAVTARACREIREYADRGGDQPFCMVVGMLLPHNPYVCQKALFEQYMDILPAPVLGAPPDEHPAVGSLRATRDTGSITLEEARLARAAYYGLVTVLDENIGAIMNTLDATSLAENTVFIYVSDHGDLNGEHGMWWKESFYEGAASVPMLWSWPAAFRAGAHVDAVTSLLDIGPTLAELAGAEPLPERHGSSLTGLLYPDGDTSAWPGAAFAETCALGQRPARMIRADRWKLNAYHGYPDCQLFDMQADPAEMHDLGRDPAYADIRRELLERVMDGWDGDYIEARHRLRVAELRVTQQWRGRGGPRCTEIWEMPVGCNVREPE